MVPAAAAVSAPSDTIVVGCAPFLKVVMTRDDGDIYHRMPSAKSSCLKREITSWNASSAEGRAAFAVLVVSPKSRRRA